MDSDIKRRWVEALRSGDYQQTTGVLKDEYGYCCLGVLCELARQDGVVDLFDGYIYGDAERQIFDSSTLPQPVLEWADLPLGDPEVYVGVERDFNLTSSMPNAKVYLTNLNDVWGQDFGQIATVIEERL